MRFYSLIIAALLIISSCRKTEDISATMQPAMNNAAAFQYIAAHSFVPVAIILSDWRNSTAIPFVSSTDSGVWFDYKNGRLCTDGLIRKGKFLLLTNIGFSNNGFKDTILVSASPADSFAIIAPDGPVYFSGKLKFISFSAYDITVSGESDIRLNDKNITVSLNGQIQLDPEGQTTRSAKFRTRWNADASVNGGELYHYDVTRSSDCFPCFSIGTGHNSSNSVTLNFNPFGNAACDPVVKFTSGREEWLVDLW